MTQLSLYFDDSIDEYSKDIFIQSVLVGISQNNLTELIVFLRSNGGLPSASFALYDFLTTNLIPKEIKTTVINIGQVSSAAVNFYMGFQERYCIPASTFMIHNAKFNGIGGDYRQLMLYVNENIRTDTRTRNILLNTCYIGTKAFTNRSLIKFMNNETTFTDTESVNYGISHGIRSIPMPPNTFLITAATRPIK